LKLRKQSFSCLLNVEVMTCDNLFPKQSAHMKKSICHFDTISSFYYTSRMRHCEERSNPAVRDCTSAAKPAQNDVSLSAEASVAYPLDCFVPRNDVEIYLLFLPTFYFFYQIVNVSFFPIYG
jgi:hypothetical protein